MPRARVLSSLVLVLTMIGATPLACVSSSPDDTPRDAGAAGNDATTPSDAAGDAREEPAADAAPPPPNDAGTDASANDANVNDASVNDASANDGGVAAHLYVVDQNNGRAYAVPLDANGATAPVGAFSFFKPIGLRFDATPTSAYGATQDPGGIDYLWEFPAHQAIDGGSTLNRCDLNGNIGNGSLTIAHGGSILAAVSLGGGSYGVEAYAPDSPTAADAGAVRTITAAQADLTNVDGIDVDAVDQIYVHDSFAKKIVVYAANANGAASPIASNSIATADGNIRFDRSTNTLYVADFFGNGVSAYSVDGGGHLTLLRTITGANTALAHPFGLVIDAAHLLYVANSQNGSVTVYPANADGNQAPSRTITLSGVTGTYFVDLEIGP